jgi:hypothetical protein
MLKYASPSVKTFHAAGPPFAHSPFRPRSPLGKPGKLTILALQVFQEELLLPGISYFRLEELHG